MRSRIVLKVVSIFLVSSLVGLGLGRQQARAESKNVWVSPVGTVGTVSTTGFPSQGSVGRSTSSLALYWLRAHTKIWHVGPILQRQDNKDINNARSISTEILKSSGYGDYAVTYHEFRYQQGSSLSTAYTSDNGARSCSAAWNTFVFNC
jgi:hypothetical protein